MLEIAKTHPDLVVFIGFILSIFFVFVYKNRRYGIKIADMETSMNFSFGEMGIKDLYADVNVSSKAKKETSPGLTINLLGETLKKGYDFFVCNFDGKHEELVPWHKHRRSSEFFYVLEGSLRITVETDIHTLNKGEILMVPATKLHSIYFDKPCKFITIAKPSLFSRIGKFYDKIRKILQNAQ